MTNWQELKKEILSDPEAQKAYDDLEFEFSLYRLIIEKRIKEGLTQKELAERMGTKQTAISRFESGNYNPTLSFLKKLTEALGVKLEIKIS